MTTKKVISIPKIPQNLPAEIRKPLDQLRQAIIDLQAQTTQPIDGRDLIFGSVSQQQLTPELLIDVNAVRFYIEPLNGTSIKNASGTLTIRAVRVDGTGSTLLTAGDIKLFKPDGTIAGNGYTWTATAADITDSITVTLRDQNTLLEWDSITLVDITDGGDAVIGAVDATNGLVWTRAIDSGVWVPATTTTDLIATFYQLGVQIASRTVRVTRSASGTLTAALEANNGEPTTHAITGSGTETLSVLFTHTASGATVIEAVLTVQGGDSGEEGVSGFIEPENGLAWTRDTNLGAWTPAQLTTDLDCTFRKDGADVARIARRITLTDATGALASSTETHKDTNLNTGRVTVTVSGATLSAITVQFDYSFGGFEASIAATVSSAQGGNDGVLHFLTNEAHVIPSNFDGTGYDTNFTGAGGTHKVFDGVTDVTTTAVHSIVSPATKNGLTISVVAGTGVYSLSGTAWTTDIETFTVRAVFNSVNYDKEYTIAKAKQGTDGGCDTDTLTAISLLDLGSNDPAIVGFRMNSPGDMSEKADAPSGYVTKETWIGACANTEYECNYLHTGSALTGGSAAVNTWLLCDTTRTYELNTGGAPKMAGGTFQIRRISDNTVVATVSVLLDVETNL